MPDSAPRTTVSAPRQSVGDHYPVGMRRASALDTTRGLPLPVLALVVIACNAATTLPRVTAFHQPSDVYLICKKLESHLCIAWPIELNDKDTINKLYSNPVTVSHCGISLMKPITPHHNFIEITPLRVSIKTKTTFCKKINVISKEKIIGSTLEAQIGGLYRTRRQVPYSPRGRYRGQTQSQYLAIDRGNGKDEGKAEAHSAADSSRASVSGKSGMGQAQSQTIYDPSCDECVGGSGSGPETLKRWPLEGPHGGKTGSPQNGGGLFPPSQSGPQAGGGLFPHSQGGPQGGGGPFQPSQGGPRGGGGGGLFPPSQGGPQGGGGLFPPGQGGLQGGGGQFPPSQGGPQGGGGLFPPSQGGPQGGGVLSPPSQSGPQGGGGQFPPSQGGPQGGVGLFPPSQGGPQSGGGLFPPSQGGPQGGGGQFPPSQGGSQGGGGLFPPSQGGPQGGGGLFPPSQGGPQAGGGLSPPSQSGPQGGGGAYPPSQGGPQGGGGAYPPSQGGPQGGGRAYLPSQGGPQGGGGAYPPTQGGHQGGGGAYPPSQGSSQGGGGAYPPSQGSPQGGGGAYLPSQGGPQGGGGAYLPNQGGPQGGGGAYLPSQGGPQGGGGAYLPSQGGPQGGGGAYLPSQGGPQGGGGAYPPNQGGPQGGGGAYPPIQGGIQWGSFPPNQKGPFDVNWPSLTNALSGSTSPTYFCCVVGSNPQYTYSLGGGTFPKSENDGITSFNVPRYQQQYDIPPNNLQTVTGHYENGKNNLQSPNGPYGLHNVPYNQQSPNGSYGPGGTGNHNNVQSPNGPYGTGSTGGTNNFQTPNQLAYWPYGTGSPNGQNNVQSPNRPYVTGSTGTGAANNLQSPNGPYNAGGTGSQIPNGPYNNNGEGAQSNFQSPNGLYDTRGTGAQSNLQTSNDPYGTGTGGQKNLQTLNVPYGTTDTGGQNNLQSPYGPYATNGSGDQNNLQSPKGPYATNGSGGQNNLQSPIGPYGTSGIADQNNLQTPNGPYGISGAGGHNNLQTAIGPYGNSGIGYGGLNGLNAPYDTNRESTGGPYNGYENGQYDNRGNIGSNGNNNYNGGPQNVVDPNSITSTLDGDDSEALASVSQNDNGTIASASSKGGNDKGRAQTQVQGTYTGNGSFSAQAKIEDENKGAESQVEGGKQGGSSNANGRGRNNKSQASVQLGSETGSIQTQSNSEGVMHSSNSQVQGSVKGGMADAQARGPGSTSSQAQIGFTPYNEADKTHEKHKTPFVGEGTATAQSSGRTGQSQSQLQGTFKYGITYNGAAQAGASLDKDAVFANRLPYNKINVFDEKDKNIDVNTEPLPDVTTLPAIPLYSDDTTDNIDNAEIEETVNNSESRYATHVHSEHHKPNDKQNEATNATPVSSRRSFQPSYNTNGADYEYTTSREDTPPDEYDMDPTETEQGEYANYDEYSKDSETTHQSLHTPNRKGLEVKQTTGGNTQHIVLDSLNGQDAQITQKTSEHPDESKIYQPGERVPGTGGYTIPIGFTGSVKSVSSKEKTYVVGSSDSPSQAQTVSLSRGTGKVKYVYPKAASIYGKTVNPRNLKSLYDSKSDDKNRYVSVSKSVTGALDSENNIKKQYSHTYYTKSSSCGYFTFTCTIVSGSNGRKKVCKPKIPTNPDGTPMNC